MSIHDKIEQLKQAAWDVGRSFINQRGEEICDPTPLEIPIDCKRPDTLEEIVKSSMSAAVQAMLSHQGVETYDEANNFETDDDGNPIEMDGAKIDTPYQDPTMSDTWMKDQEIRSGIVKEPNWAEVKALKAKLDSALLKLKEAQASKDKPASPEKS